MEVDVLACRQWNDSGIDVTEGQTVRISASGEWTDWRISTGPNGFERWYLRPFVFLKRCRRAPWFCLIASIGKDARTCHVVGDKGGFTAKSSGRLYLYANDAWSKYGNNSGRIVAKVEVTD